MINKILISLSVTVVLLFMCGWLVTYLSFGSGYRKGYDAGIEWERNIILEYVAPKVVCDNDCDVS
jgi:hypothetical protein